MSQPPLLRGPERIRTAVAGFADLSLATRPQDPVCKIPQGETLKRGANIEGFNLIGKAQKKNVPRCRKSNCTIQS